MVCPPDRDVVSPATRRPAALALLAVIAALALLAVAVAGPAHAGSGGAVPDPEAADELVPPPGGFAAARAFTRTRRGRIAWAIVGSDGTVQGYGMRARFVTASVVKAMLLVAYLDRRARQGRALDARDRAVLEPMITHSDNGTATTAWRLVGDAGLRRVAQRAGMQDFVVGPTFIPSCRCSGRAWSRAQITALDQARFFHGMDALLPARHRGYARSLLAGITPSQRWGIPEMAEPEWIPYFKVGGRDTGLGRVVHQVARLEDDRGRSVSIAILTDGNPDRMYGIRTLRGIANALLWGSG